MVAVIVVTPKNFNGPAHRHALAHTAPLQARLHVGVKPTVGEHPKSPAQPRAVAHVHGLHCYLRRWGRRLLRLFTQLRRDRKLGVGSGLKIHPDSAIVALGAARTRAQTRLAAAHIWPNRLARTDKRFTSEVAMRLRTVLMIVVVAAIVLFGVLNWSAFTARTPLSLGLGSVEAPVGVMLLVPMALLTALFLIYVVYLQTSALLQGRRHARELQSHRELAEQAEASRFSELRAFLEAELKTLATRGEDSKGELLGRLDQLESELRAAVEQSGTSLSAYIGELEDRIERVTSAGAAKGPS